MVAQRAGAGILLQPASGRIGPGHCCCIHYPATLKAALSLGWNWRNCGADFDYG